VPNKLDVIGSDRQEAALPFGDAVAPIVIDVDIEAIRLKKLELGEDLVGEHGVAKSDEHIAQSRTARVRIRPKLIAAELPVVFRCECDALDTWDSSDAILIGPAGDVVVKSREKPLGPKTADGLIFEVAGADAALD
jgi:hypothetical protein